MNELRWAPRLLRTAAFAAGVMAASMAAAPAQAAPLPNNGQQFFAGTTNFTGTLAGVLVDSTQGAASSGTVTGFGKTAVFRNADNTLSFYYQLKNQTAAGGDSIHRFTAINFAGWQVTDVGFRTDSVVAGAVVFEDAAMAGIGALQRYEWVDRSNTGSTVGWDYNIDQGLDVDAGGDTTVTMVVRTNATHYTAGSWNFINGGVGSGPGFAPSATPEPASMTLAMAAFGPAGLALLKRRRRSSQVEETEEA